MKLKINFIHKKLQQFHVKSERKRERKRERLFNNYQEKREVKLIKKIGILFIVRIYIKFEYIILN